MTAFNLLLVFKIKMNKTKYYKIGTSITDKNTYTNYYKTIADINFANNGIKLDSLIMLKNATNSKGARIKDLFKDSEKLLICRFSEFNCQECVTYSILKAISQQDHIRKNNIILWGDYESCKNLKIYKENLDIKETDVYNVGFMNIPIEQKGVPYYFILDSTLQITDLFIPDRAFSHAANHYFEIIQKKHFQ